jgi:Na+-driven multidrug efflux pump
MFIGALLNMILDPVFIFLFGWGVEGAAWATIISQLAACIWILSFNLFSAKAVIRLRLKTFRPSWRIVFQIMSFGSAQFLLQFIMSGVQLLLNFSVSLYGAAALGVANGGDIALTGMNICGSIIQLIFMPIFGINQGAQPILGYNYGAKKYRRVLRTYIGALAGATVICVLGFAVAELFPHSLIWLFAPQGSPALLRFTPWAMRVIMLMLPLNGFQIISSNIFSVTGRPKVSIVLSMLRQCIVLIPCILIFGRLWGLYGVVAASPTADGVSFFLTGIVMLLEIRRLRAAAVDREEGRSS